MYAICEVKTTNRQIKCLWPSEGDKRDFAQYGAVGSWIAKQGKSLDKHSTDSVAKLLREQFPILSEVEVRDYSGRGVRLHRG